MLELQEIVGIRSDYRKVWVAANGDEVLHKLRRGDKLPVVVRPELALLRHEHIKQQDGGDGRK